MKILLSFFFSILSFALLAQELIPLPAATVYDSNEHPVLTTSISNGDSPTVIVTYATAWSYISIDLLDDLSKTYNEERQKSGVKIVAIDCESKKNADEVTSEVIKHQWASFEFLHDRDGSFMRTMKAHTAPLVFFLDANGIIIYCVQSCNLSASKIYSIANSIKLKKITSDIVYFDSLWFPCEKTEAIYYRNIKKDSLGKFQVTDYFMNGHFQMQSTCLLVYPHYRTGMLTYYYSSGQKKTSGYYLNDEKSGIWFSWNEDGTYQSKITYTHDKKNGYAEEFHSNGQLEKKGNYYQGMPDGNWMNYYDNGAKKSEIQWNKGMKEWSVGWYENGSMKFKIASYKNNMPGAIETYYSSGLPVNIFIYNRDSVITEIKQFYETGELKSSSKFMPGNKLNFTEYYANGKFKTCFYLNNNKLDGKFSEWYENGKKKSELEFNDGQIVNKGMAWYDNGQIKEKNNFTTQEGNMYSADGKKQDGTTASVLEIYNSAAQQDQLFSITINYYMEFLDQD